ncbi:NAD(P)-dependent dehydrogenase (short-subunit alcohol dehydrogenase family) [Thermocatellispora tengchongensis]|uniref:NAD(P)-dependent dehydrogenase (Short-subunit alcohol dehydrogenase family) n=1 Tax=Thermocatellispora tengchongensis TaxID=1073253 RepID=A0A840PFB8_9ACTN|nr:SDR family oxidoreductase [Thermocatellispora tengchongensis]MBB5137862.1 NAD(P)-dependent dehydrogenase (short-subunit alcohol dehydrogenase family) [Thermocatellispora tengchongensis]
MPTTVITGGTGGIGVETARALLAASPDRAVALVDLKVSDIPEPLAAYGGRVAVFACDVTDEQSVAATGAEIRAAMPSVDSLVNGAGIVHNDASIDMPMDRFRAMLAVHVEGTLLWCRQVARSLHGPGSIVNIGSIAGQFGHPRRIAYGAAKAAVHSITKTLAVEWAGRGIRVNAVTPGYIETPMMKEVARIGLVDADVAAGWAAMKRLGSPAEVAAAIRFLLSDEASFITGHILNVDGGFAVLKAE